MGLTNSIVRRAAGPARLGLRAGETAIGAAVDLVRGARSVLGHGREGHGDATPTAPAGARLEPEAPEDTTVPPHGDAVAPGGAPDEPRGAAAPAVSATPTPAEPAPPRGSTTARTPAAPAGDSALEGVPAAGPEGEAMPAGPPPAGAKRVDDEVVSAGEFGEPGAEEDAGAEVHVDPPWDHYDDMTAAQVSDRLRAADAGLAAAVSLYESNGRARKSVIRAAEGRLRALDAAPPGS